MLFATLKNNKNNGIDYIDIAVYYEECYGEIADLFEDVNDFDDCFTKHTERQIASACLKYMKADETILNWKGLLWDLDIPEIVYDDLAEMVESGAINRADLEEFDKKCSRKGVTIVKEVDNGDYTYSYHYISDLIEQYFPCNVELEGVCNNCGNCD